VPPEVDDCRKRIEALETELAIIARETAVGVDTAEREAAAGDREARRAARASRRTETRWDAERELVEKSWTARQAAGGRRGSKGTGSDLEPPRATADVGGAARRTETDPARR
jgi:type VI secretion system protein VasG